MVDIGTKQVLRLYFNSISKTTGSLRHIIKAHFNSWQMASDKMAFHICGRNGLHLGAKPVFDSRTNSLAVAKMALL